MPAGRRYQGGILTLPEDHWAAFSGPSFWGLALTGERGLPSRRGQGGTKKTGPRGDAPCTHTGHPAFLPSWCSHERTHATVALPGAGRTGLAERPDHSRCAHPGSRAPLKRRQYGGGVVHCPGPCSIQRYERGPVRCTRRGAQAPAEPPIVVISLRIAVTADTRRESMARQAGRPTGKAVSLSGCRRALIDENGG